MGTSASYYINPVQTEDHPHAYGDKLDGIEQAKARAGSSPRVWGQVSVTSLKRTPSRIIPTRMGTRGNYSVATSTDEDHPHAYGDKIPDDSEEALALGSSPRVWGQDYVKILHENGTRIIPTRMGTSIAHGGADLDE